MRRIDSSNVQVDKFGPGKHGFQGGNPSTNTPATFLAAAWADALQEEIANVIEHFGYGLVPGDNSQLISTLLAKFMLASAYEGEIGKISYVPSMTANVNHLEAFGAEVNRVGAYAGLWAYAQASGMLVTDAVFANRPGCFGYGSGGVGGTTFRVPKLAGLVIKSYHNGDGTYTTNMSALNGEYTPDQLLAHTHSVLASSANGGTKALTDPVSNGLMGAAGDASNYQAAPGGQPLTPITSVVGFTENTIRSVILLPQIKYR